MIEKDYEAAHKYATNKRELLIAQMPLKLMRKEKKVFKKIRLSAELPLRRLEKLFDFIDELNSYVDKFTPCKEGCSYCCYISTISISTLEVEYIENHFGKKRIMKPVGKDYFGIPCPFLEKVNLPANRL